MKTFLPLSLLVLSVSACSGMQGMQSSGDSSRGMRAYSDVNPNSTSYPVINPHTGQLTLYHGG